MSNRYLDKIASFMNLGEGTTIEHGHKNMINYPEESVPESIVSSVEDRARLLHKIKDATINKVNTGALINAITPGPV